VPSTFREYGQSGLQRSAGIITEEEFVPALSGRAAIRTFKDMRDNDPVVGAIFYAIEAYIRQVQWRVDPYGEEPKDLEDATFIEECMEDMSMTWEDVVSEALTCLEFGWSFLEIGYKRRNGPQTEGSKKPSSKFTDSKIGWRKMPLRAQESLDKWVFDEEGGIQAMVQRPAPDYKDIEIPMRAALLFRTTVKKNNPEGRSLLRNAYEPWYYKRRIQMIEGVGIERDLAGLPFAEVDPAILDVANRTEAETGIYNSILDILKGVRRDAQDGIMWPTTYDAQGNQLYKFSLLSSGGSRQFDTSAIIDRYVKHMAMTLLADFIMLGHEAVGSFALADSKTAMFGIALGSILDMMEGVFNRYAIPRLCQLNGMDMTRLPKIAHGDIEKPDLTVLAGFLSSLSSAGMPLFPDPKLQEFIRDVAGLPEKQDEENDVPTAKPPTPKQEEPADPGAEEEEKVPL